MEILQKIAERANDIIETIDGGHSFSELSDDGDAVAIGFIPEFETDWRYTRYSFKNVEKTLLELLTDGTGAKGYTLIDLTAEKTGPTNYHKAGNPHVFGYVWKELEATGVSGKGGVFVIGTEGQTEFTEAQKKSAEDALDNTGYYDDTHVLFSLLNESKNANMKYVMLFERWCKK